MTGEPLLARLENVRQTAPGRWIARCPAHADKSPSLSVRELPDGRVLLHDFGGCEVGDILAAVGMTIGELFPERLGHHVRPSRSRVPASDLLQLIADEVGVIAMAGAQLIEKKNLTEPDWQRIAQAHQRITGAAAEMHS